MINVWFEIENLPVNIKIIKSKWFIDQEYVFLNIYDINQIVV